MHNHSDVGGQNGRNTGSGYPNALTAALSPAGEGEASFQAARPRDRARSPRMHTARAPARSPFRPGHLVRANMVNGVGNATNGGFAQAALANLNPCTPGARRHRSNSPPDHRTHVRRTASRGHSGSKGRARRCPDKLIRVRWQVPAAGCASRATSRQAIARIPQSAHSPRQKTLSKSGDHATLVMG